MQILRENFHSMLNDRKLRGGEKFKMWIERRHGVRCRAVPVVSPKQRRRLLTCSLCVSRLLCIIHSSQHRGLSRARPLVGPISCVTGTSSHAPGRPSLASRLRDFRDETRMEIAAAPSFRWTVSIRNFSRWITEWDGDSCWKEVRSRVIVHSIDISD